MNLKTSETMRSPAGAVDPVAHLLRGLIDYAGLFPPASLTMAPAVANYATYSESEYSWVLGRFILPVARLGEFESARADAAITASAPGKCWALSVLPGADLPSDVGQIRRFNDRFAASHPVVNARIKSLEVKAASPEDVERLSKIIPAELETYFEIPSTPGARDCIAAVATHGRRAKVRTGGETADRVPTPESVLEFLRLCAAANVPFKATAGLHHPLRSVHRFTYQPESPSGTMHGFLNVFLAAAFLHAGLDPALVLQLLKEQSADAFHVDPDGIAWRDHRLSAREISAARHDFSVSFGSCSFTEPIDDLRSLHLL